MLSRAVLQRINALVNATVTYVPEAPGQDVWRPAETHGDCEDIALAKRERLRAMGGDPDRMHIGLCADRATGQWHAVLVVEADDGTWALDNWRAREPVGLAELFRWYRPLRIGGPGGQWTMWQEPE